MGNQSYNTVESYHEFLNQMETVDYSDNQVFVNKYNYHETHSNDNQPKRNSIPIKVLPNSSLSFSNSYPPSTLKDHRYSFPRDQNSVDFLADHPEYTENTANTSLDVNLSKSLETTSCSDSNEFVNIQDFNMPLDLQQDFGFMDDSTSVISCEDDYDEVNPVVPGLFPKMNINDNTEFLKFDKLPLNPSYISH